MQVTPLLLSKPTIKFNMAFHWILMLIYILRVKKYKKTKASTVEKNINIREKQEKRKTESMKIPQRRDGNLGT